jgi:hypothetical protein
MKKGFTEVTTQPDFTKVGGASGLDLRKRTLFTEIFSGRDLVIDRTRRERLY